MEYITYKTKEEINGEICEIECQYERYYDHSINMFINKLVPGSKKILGKLEKELQTAENGLKTLSQPLN